LTVTVTDVLCFKLPKAPVRVNVNVPFVSEFFAKLMVTVAFAEPEPFNGAGEGEMTHFEVEGPPEHDSWTLPINPLMGVTVRLKTAECAIGIV
jgi:hypothetical protein